MIIIKSQTFPGMRQGYLCSGKVNTNASGIGTITFTGKDVSSKITGIQLTPLNADDLIINCNVTSIVYSAGVNTITFKAQTQLGSLTPLQTFSTEVVAALRVIISNAPAGTAALLTEIGTAATAIENIALTEVAPTGVAFDGDVYYSFWVNDDTLPTDESTNNPGTENL